MYVQDDNSKENFIDSVKSLDSNHKKYIRVRKMNEIMKMLFMMLAVDFKALDF